MLVDSCALDLAFMQTYSHITLTNTSLYDFPIPNREKIREEDE